MMLSLYSHPFSSYSQKAIMAFYEKDIPFETKMLDNSEPVSGEFRRLWPIRKFPILTDGERLVFEATGIIEYLEARFPERFPLIPADPLLAAEVRMWDRFFDNYISYPVQRIVLSAASMDGDPSTDMSRWHEMLETAYGILERRMEGRQWVAGDDFTMADCAAAPFLLYADWLHEISKDFPRLRDYRNRLLARPSYARALDEARPYRHLFPLKVPEGRD